MKASVGRIVHVVCGSEDVAAIVTRVRDHCEGGDCVVVTAFPPGRPPVSLAHVPYSADALPYTWHWPEVVQ